MSLLLLFGGAGGAAAAPAPVVSRTSITIGIRIGALILSLLGSLD